MRWRSEWRGVSDRILDLKQTGEFIFAADPSLGEHGSTPAVNEFFIPALNAVFEELRRFRDRFVEILPENAAYHLRGIVSEENVAPIDGFRGAQRLLVQFLSFRAAFDHYAVEAEAPSRRLVERAFAHLQRLLVVDPIVAKKWARAFAEGEVACERLGAVHLLAHGIWAFKTSGTGERTDLVLGEPLRDLSQVDRSAEALVLTEWKRIRLPRETPEVQAAAALRQARRYSAGIHFGTELESVRYLPLVSIDQIPTPPDFVDGNIHYRYLNIAVAPSVPSAKVGRVSSSRVSARRARS